MPRPMRRLAQAFTTANHAATATVGACGAAAHPAPGKGQAEPRGGRHVFWLWVGVCVFGGVRIGLLCLLTARCIVCLLGLLLCACFRLSLPLLGSFIFWLKAPCFGSFVVPAGGTALPLGLGDLNNLFLLVGLGLFILSRNTVSNPFAGYQP